MEQYAGLDVSLKAVSICVTDALGAVLWRGEVFNDASAVCTALSRRAPRLARTVLESGSCGIHLYRGLKAAGVPVVCVCARHAKGVLQCRVNKTDANDAEGLAQLAWTGWYREVYVKSAEAHVIRAHLLARKQIAKARRDLENQLRAQLRVFGLKVGAVARAGFEARVRLLADQVPAVEAPIDQLLLVRRSLLAAQDTLDKEAKTLAKQDARCELLQTMPGVGPLTALAFVSTVDGSARFAKSSALGAYLGLTPRGHQSGAVAWTGRISKTGDALTRALLYEAANVLMVRVKAWPPLKVWAVKLADRIGAKKARVALARKLAVILHRMLADATAYRWKAAA
ncbi:MAG TPA: IS110 family transposase [Rhodospirillales bacterium]|jgi:transposase|nr:IS110 family transposase [Rhodospirillales bacterium]